MKDLSLLCVLGVFWQGNFHYDEILEVLQERTLRELTVPVAVPHALPCLLLLMGRVVLHCSLGSVCHCLQDKTKGEWDRYTVV